MNKSIMQVLQTGARVLWDVEINKILSLESETPVEVQIQRDGSRWNLVSSQGNVCPGSRFLHRTLLNIFNDLGVKDPCKGSL